MPVANLKTPWLGNRAKPHFPARWPDGTQDIPERYRLRSAGTNNQIALRGLPDEGGPLQLDIPHIATYQIRLSLEYLSECISADQPNIQAGPNIYSLPLSRFTCSARVTGNPRQ